MIEIEKNFDLRSGDKERLIAGAKFLKKKTFTDVYYDNDAYNLTGRDFWLRTRDGRFELKVPLNTKNIGNRKTDRYRELETDAEIIRELGFAAGASLYAGLAKSGYKPFATITTTRETYQKGDFHLDFDEVDFGLAPLQPELSSPYSYDAERGRTFRTHQKSPPPDAVVTGFTTFEAELMVSEPHEIAEAERRILEFAHAHGIAGTEGRGKVIEYIARNRPEHYAALLTRGVVERRPTE